MRPGVGQRDSGLPTVVVPVYNAAGELDRCLDSLHATLPRGADVLVIDDDSPDPAVGRMLERWRALDLPGWEFQRNGENLGFVGTANLGFRSAAGDVVLLNSDTEATPGWLQGLARCLASDPLIATATPWTNNGEIASIPRFCAANPVPPDRDSVAVALTGAGAPRYPDIPTAVGFCMAVSRVAIECLGGFDEALFGRGYGEENDFSLRAQEAGMRNVLCDDVYVVHLGGRSFGPLGLQPGPHSMQRLLSRHPGYLDRIREFIDADPLASRRAEILNALRQAGLSLE